MKLSTRRLTAILGLFRRRPSAETMNGGTSLSLRTNTPLIVLAFVAVFVLGAGIGTVLTALFIDKTPINQSTNTGLETPGESSAEAGFARDMMVHHAQAVHMAEIVRSRTESNRVRKVASDIARSQQQEIGQMRGWLEAWGLSTTGSDPAMKWMGHPTEGRMPGMASSEEIDRLRTSSPVEMDTLFLRFMIPHHQAALPMANAVLERTDRPEVEKFAMGVVASQQDEIAKMETLLQTRGISVENSPIPEEAPSSENEPHHKSHS